MSDTTFQPRWRMDITDDTTVRFDPATHTLTKIKTGETCHLEDYATFAFEEPRFLWVTSSHAPPIGKWYVIGEE